MKPDYRTNMNTTYFCLKSQSENSYLVTRSKPQILFVHPAMSYLIEAEEKYGDLKLWIENSVEQVNSTLDTLSISKQDLLYYINYFYFLKSNGYFNNRTVHEIPEKMYSAATIEENLINCEQISFEVSNKCSLNCEYCCFGDYYEVKGERNIQDLSFKTAQNLLDYFHTLKLSNKNIKVSKSIFFSFYGGEPLLNFSFISKMVDYVKTKNWGDHQIEFRMTTNGVDLDKYMDYLVENKFTLLISLDGNHIHNEFRIFHNGRPSFSKIMNNCLKLKEKYPDFFETKVQFNAVIHKLNSVKEAKAFFKETFNKDAMLSPLATSNLKTEKKAEFFDKVYENKQDEFQSNDFDNLILRDILFSHSNYIIRSYSQLTDFFEKVTVVSTGTCAPFSRKIFLTTEGKVLPCERISHQYDLGYVDDNSVQIDFQKIADLYNHWFSKMRPSCNNCNRNHYCNLCIFQLNLNEKPVICDRLASFSDYKQYLVKNISYIEKNRKVYQKGLNEK